MQKYNFNLNDFSDSDNEYIGKKKINSKTLQNGEEQIMNKKENNN